MSQQDAVATTPARAWWQQILLERLPEDAAVRFVDEGSGIDAVFGPWRLYRGAGNGWIDLYGPCIYPSGTGRVVIHGRRGRSWADQLEHALRLLDALGAPVRAGRRLKL